MKYWLMYIGMEFKKDLLMCFSTYQINYTETFLGASDLDLYKNYAYH